MKKLIFHSEVAYIAATILLALAVAMLSAADFGISMIVAPAYLLSVKTGFLSFGQAEYIIQACLFIAFCIIMKKIKPVYFASFFTCLFYGAVLDLWRCVPFFNPNVTPPGSMALYLRIILFVCGMLLTSFSIALFYKTYLYPQVYDFFVKGISAKFKIKLSLFKTAFDVSCLIFATLLSLIFFKGFVGISWGTLVISALNGTIIGLFVHLFDNVFVFKPIFIKFSEKFAL